MSYSREQMIAIGIISTVIPVIFVGLRVWARLITKAGFWWDDYLTFFALVLTIGVSALQLIAAIHGRLGQHNQVVDEFGLPDLTDPRFLVYMDTKFALQLIGNLGYGVVKMAVCTLYIRIFSPRKFRLVCQVVLGVVIAWTIAIFFATLFSCIPITPLSEPFWGNNCIDTIAFWYAGGVSDIVLDFILLVLPAPMVWGLQLPFKQKLVVLAMFLLGGIACAASILRLVVFFQVGEDLAAAYYDVTYLTAPVFFWSVIELWLAIVACCLPTLRPLFKKLGVVARSTLGGSSRGQSKNPDSSGISEAEGKYKRASSHAYEMNTTQKGQQSRVSTNVRAQGEHRWSDVSRDDVILVRDDINYHEYSNRV